MFSPGDKVKFNSRAREVFGKVHARPGVFTVSKVVPPDVVELEETGHQWYDKYFHHVDEPDTEVLPAGPYLHKRHNEVVLLDSHGVYAFVGGIGGSIVTTALPVSEHHLMIPIPVPKTGE